MDERTGYIEHITKSWDEGGRRYEGYVGIVNVPGDDTYEVGLSPLRRALNWGKLTPERVRILMTCKPNTVNFTGKFIDHGEFRTNTLQLTGDSAKDWADRTLQFSAAQDNG